MIDYVSESKERYQLQQEFLGTEKLVNRTQPMVSVSVATYQHAGFIEQCLDGILAQETDFPYEIIVGEDGSEDGTRAICIRYATKHQDKIRLFLRDRNTTVMTHEGRQYRFNGVFCRMSARGQYIAMCEGDDYWTDTHKLQKQVEFLEANSKCSMCFHNALELHDGGVARIIKPPGAKRFFALHDLLAQDFIALASVMLRSELIKELPSWYYGLPVGDWPLYICLARYGVAGHLDQTMSVYRVHTGGIWSGSDNYQRMTKVLEVYETLHDHLGIDNHPTIRREISRLCLGLGAFYADQGQHSDAKRYLKRSIREAPINPLLVDQGVLFARLYMPSIHRRIKGLMSK